MRTVDFLAEQLKELQLDHLAACVDLRRDKAILHATIGSPAGAFDERMRHRRTSRGRRVRGFVSSNVSA